MADYIIDDLTLDEQVELFTTRTRTPVIKIEWIDSNNIVFRETVKTLIGGSLSVQLQNGQRRTLNMDIINDSESLIPSDEDSDIWFDKRVRLYTGLKLGDDRYFEEQGIFRFGNPTFNSNGIEETISISCYDKYSEIDGTLGGILRYGYEIPVGSIIGSAIRGIFTEAGETISPIINPVLDTKTTPYSIRVGNGDTYFSMLNTMAEAYSQTTYYDESGIPRFEDQPKQNNVGSVWEFVRGDGIMLDMSHNYNIVDMYNAIQVYSQNSSSLVVYKGYSQDDDVFSPTYVGKIGVKLKEPINNDAIPDDYHAQLLSDYELLKAKEIYEDISLTCIPINIIREGDIVLVTNPNTGANRDRFMVIGFSFPLDFSGTMTLNLSKARTIQDIILL